MFLLTHVVQNFIDTLHFIHNRDVIMGAVASQITSLIIVYSTVYSDADQSKHQSTASLAFVRGIHWGPMNSPHKWPVTRKMFPFDDVIMVNSVFVAPDGDRNKVTTTLQTIFSNAISWLKIFSIDTTFSEVSSQGSNGDNMSSDMSEMGQVIAQNMATSHNLN